MTPPIGIVFPGQGSQAINMLSDIATEYKEVLDVFAEASSVLGYDLWQLCQEGPLELLNQTIHTQPALLTASFALWRILKAHQPMTNVMLAGHSLGEYTALVCAKSLKFEEAVQLVAARGQYMQEAVLADVGAMAAIIGLDDEAVLEICQEATHDDLCVSPANFNSIGQVVVAGHKSAVQQAILLAKENGAKLATIIPVSVPSHCLLMKPAAERLSAKLEAITLSPPIFPVINNIDATPYKDIASIRNGLIKQLYSPVQWVRSIQYFIQNGIQTIIECGPGKILTGLNKRINKNLDLLPTDTLDHLNHIILTDERKNHVS